MDVVIDNRLGPLSVLNLILPLQQRLLQNQYFGNSEYTKYSFAILTPSRVACSRSQSSVVALRLSVCETGGPRYGSSPLPAWTSSELNSCVACCTCARANVFCTFVLSIDEKDMA